MSIEIVEERVSKTPRKEYIREAIMTVALRRGANHTQASYTSDAKGFRSQPVAELGGLLGEMTVRQWLDDLGHTYEYCAFSTDPADYRKPDFNVNGYQIEVKHTTNPESETVWLTDSARNADACVLVYIPWVDNDYDVDGIQLVGVKYMTQMLRERLAGRGYEDALGVSLTRYMFDLAERLEEYRAVAA